MTLDEDLVCTAIEAMYLRGKFSISVIDRACALLRVVPDRNYHRLAMLDGVKFIDLDEGTQEILPALICSVISAEGRTLRITFEDEGRMINGTTYSKESR